MDEHCKLIDADCDNLVSHVREIAAHISKLQESPEGATRQVSLRFDSLPHSILLVVGVFVLFLHRFPMVWPFSFALA